jgi:ubiquinone/menaquinone biosynthesis C-methylase UbiE
MPEDAVENVYDKSGCARYRILTRVFFYPFGLRDFVFRKIPLTNDARILDAGCGYGILSRAVYDKVRKEGLVGIEQHAFDISADMLQAFKEMCPEGEIQVRQLDVRDLTYNDEYFDLIVTSAMLEYVPNVENALTSLKRCLKPGGAIYVFMSRKSPLNDLLFRPFGNPKCYSFGQLADIFSRSGFRNITRHRFPLRSLWLNAWGVIIEATK